jgi:hypothetical protein
MTDNPRQQIPDEKSAARSMSCVSKRGFSSNRIQSVKQQESFNRYKRRINIEASQNGI